MEILTTTAQLPKSVKRLATLDMYVNGVYQKTIDLGRITARQMCAVAGRIARREFGRYSCNRVTIYAAFGCLHLAEISTTTTAANGVTIEIPACALRCLLADIAES